MCKYRYEYFSYCGHQAFYLYDYCNKASISTKAALEPLNSAYSYPDKEPYDQKIHNTHTASEKVNWPNSLNGSPFSSHSAHSVQYTADAPDMPSKTSKAPVSPQIVRDSARILETCYKALELSTVNEIRHQPSMEGSPGYRSISRHAFEERLRFFESAITSPGTDISDTLSKFTYDSKTDTLYSLDQQLKRILEKAQLMKHVSQERSAGALDDLSNGSPKPIKAKRLGKNDEGINRTLHGTLACSSFERNADATIVSKSCEKSVKSTISNVRDEKRNIHSDIPQEFALGVVKHPKALETKNARKALPSQWIFHNKTNGDRKLHESIKMEPNTPPRGNQKQIPQSTSRKNATKASGSPQTKNANLSLWKADGYHAQLSPISSKAPNLRTAERAAARGVKRGQMEMAFGTPPRNGPKVIFSQDRYSRNLKSSSKTIETTSSGSPITPMEENTDGKEGKLDCLRDYQTSENKFTFSSLLAPKPLFHAEHHRKKSSNTSTSSINQTFYSAPQSPSKPQPTISKESLAWPARMAFNCPETDRAASSTARFQKGLSTGDAGSVKGVEIDDTRSLRQSHSSPRKKPKLRVQTSFDQPQATAAERLGSSVAVPESSSGSFDISPLIPNIERERLQIINNNLMHSAAKMYKMQSAQRLEPTEEAHEISSCTAEPSSSVTSGSLDSAGKNRQISEATEHIDRISGKNEDLQPSNFTERKPSKHSVASTATDLEDADNLMSDDYAERLASMTYPAHKRSMLCNQNESTCKEPEHRLFINPSIIIQPQDAGREVEEKIVVEVREISDSESDLMHQIAGKIDDSADNKGPIQDKQGCEESHKKVEIGTEAQGTHLSYGASFSSRLKATAPDFIPQNIMDSNNDEHRQQLNEDIQEDEPFAYQMDLLSAQLQNQVMSTDYVQYNPFLVGLPQFNPFQISFVNEVHSIPSSNKRPWQKYKGKKKFKKADQGRTQRCRSPIPSIGAFRDGGSSALGFSSDSTIIEKFGRGVDGSDGPRKAENGGNKQDGDGKSEQIGDGGGDCGDDLKIGSGSPISSATDVETRNSTADANGRNGHVVTVEPCDEIVVEKASEHVGGLPCRTCYPDFLA